MDLTVYKLVIEENALPREMPLRVSLLADIFVRLYPSLFLTFVTLTHQRTQIGRASVDVQSRVSRTIPREQRHDRWREKKGNCNLIPITFSLYKGTNLENFLLLFKP